MVVTRVIILEFSLINQGCYSNYYYLLIPQIILPWHSILIWGSMSSFFDSEQKDTYSLVFLFFLLKPNLQVPVFESKIIPHNVPIKFSFVTVLQILWKQIPVLMEDIAC